jgi:TusA-related sulfurtransferase
MGHRPVSFGAMPEAILDADAFYDAGEGGCSGPALGEINRLLDALPAGRSLEVRSTDRAERESFRAYCRMRGYEIEREVETKDGDRLLVRK